MSERPPPNPNVGEFNNAYWLYFDDVLNVNQLDSRYLKFPTSQGSETINGALDVLGLTTVSASGIKFSDGTLQTTAGGASSNPTLAQTLVAGNSAGATDIDMNSRQITNALNIATQNMTSTGTITSSNITNSNTISTLDLTVSGTTTAGTIIGSDLVSKDATVDPTITNVLSAFTYFDRNIALMRSLSVYRKFWIGMTGDNVNATNRFAIGCNGVNPDQPEILMEIDATGEVSMRNGIKIFDLLGTTVGTINNFSDSPNNSTFSIRTTTGNMFLQTNNLLDCWAPSLSLGQTAGSTLTMRTDTSNTFRSRIILDDLTLFGGLGSVSNDAYIQLNSEIQNNAYTDADHAEVAKIPTIESDITTLQNEMEAVEILAGLTATTLNDKFYNFNPTGTVLTFAGNTLPTGYLWCDGAEISQTTYADLYAVIGLIYSTDRKTSPSAGNFFLPDMRGLFVCGAGVPQSTSFAFYSNTYNKTVGDFNEMSVQNHKHKTQTSSGTQSVQIGTSSARDNSTQIRTSETGVYYDDGTTPLVKNATEPFNICMNYIIKY